jgi:phospholipase D1/2
MSDLTAGNSAEETVAKSKEFADNGVTNGPLSSNGTVNDKEPRARKTSKAVEPFDQAEREEMERLLEELRGHLGAYSRFICLSGTDLTVL